MKVLEIEGVAYVYFIIDVFDRAIVGRRRASNMKTEAVLGYYTAELEERFCCTGYRHRMRSSR